MYSNFLFLNYKLIFDLGVHFYHLLNFKNKDSLRISIARFLLLMYTKQSLCFCHKKCVLMIKIV